MSGITLEQAQTQLSLSLETLTAIQQGGTEMRIGDRTIKLPTLAEAQKSYEFWAAEVQRVQADAPRGARIYGVSI